MRRLRVRAPAGSFRRAGLAFGKEPVEIDLDDLSGAQLYGLTNEPRLEVEGTLDGENFTMVPPVDEETLAAIEQDREAAKAASDQTDAQAASSTADEVDAAVGGGDDDDGDAGEGDDGAPAPSSADVSEAIDPGASADQLAAAGATPVAEPDADAAAQPASPDNGEEGNGSASDVSEAIDPAASAEQKAAAGATETKPAAETKTRKPKGGARSPRG